MNAGQDEYMALVDNNSTFVSFENHKEQSSLVRRCGFDRRLGIDRRSKYRILYLLLGKPNRRKGNERRQQGEKRDGWVRSGKWTSVCGLFITKVEFFK